MHVLERSDVAGVRLTLRKLGQVVAEVDRDLRYVWIDNPHPDFDPAAVVGRRDDELIPASEAEPIMALKREALERGEPLQRVLQFRRSEGLRYYSVCACPVRSPDGAIDGLLTIGFDVPGPPSADPGPGRPDPSAVDAASNRGVV